MSNGIEDRLNSIDQRLDSLGQEIAGLRRQQQENRTAIASLERLTSELLDIARLHQQALRTAQTDAERDRAVVREILEYLFNQQRNGNGGARG